jgi:hypothetical protein
MSAIEVKDFTVEEPPHPGPEPQVENTGSEEGPEIVKKYEGETPTMSHELANADHEEKGAAQEDHNQTEVKDLGWNEIPTDVPTPIVGGLPNEELWTLIRRFNKVGDAARKSLGTNADLGSKCIMLKPCRNHLSMDWTSTSQMKRSSHQIS